MGLRSRLGLAFGERLDLDLVVGEEAPAATGALVVPQDVHLILGEVGPVEDTRETAQQVLAAAARERPRRPGSLVIATPRPGVPLVMQAIVYDFSSSPPAREVHVFEALLLAFEEARTRGFAALAVQPLGTAHAGLARERFLRLLAGVCYSSAELGTPLRRVHLMLASAQDLAEYERILQELPLRPR